ncbi:MAG TPA: class II aldolase/adducin family protein [Armatimonadota bacterium]|jgi:rhamnulose-1-phosphate aldolase
MPVETPYPGVQELLTLIGQAGRRLAEIDASEGAAGNISVYAAWPLEARAEFPVEETLALPEPVPELAGGALLVTGSGRRLREIADDPEANLGLVRVQAGGATAALHTSSRRLFANLTSEFNSHLAVHRDQVARTGTNFHALIHAQPLHLTYLSHIARYQDTLYLNRHILRWEPECIVNLPEGVGYLPFMVPGSAQLMAANVEALRTHRVVLWAKHGVMARSDLSVKRACDRIEYAETGARYEYLNLTNHGLADGLSEAEVRAVCSAFDVKQGIF